MSSIVSLSIQELQALKRKELQALAKRHGVKANLSVRHARCARRCAGRDKVADRNGGMN
jgi:hypothetical protein